MLYWMYLLARNKRKIMRHKSGKLKGGLLGKKTQESGLKRFGHVEGRDKS